MSPRTEVLQVRAEPAVDIRVLLPTFSRSVGNPEAFAWEEK